MDVLQTLSMNRRSVQSGKGRISGVGTVSLTVRSTKSGKSSASEWSNNINIKKQQNKGLDTGQIKNPTGADPSNPTRKLIPSELNVLQQNQLQKTFQENQLQHNSDQQKLKDKKKSEIEILQNNDKISGEDNILQGQFLSGGPIARSSSIKPNNSEQKNQTRNPQLRTNKSNNSINKSMINRAISSTAQNIDDDQTTQSDLAQQYAQFQQQEIKDAGNSVSDEQLGNKITKTKYGNPKIKNIMSGNENQILNKYLNRNSNQDQPSHEEKQNRDNAQGINNKSRNTGNFQEERKSHENMGIGASQEAFFNSNKEKSPIRPINNIQGGEVDTSKQINSQIDQNFSNQQQINPSTGETSMNRQVSTSVLLKQEYKKANEVISQCSLLNKLGQYDKVILEIEREWQVKQHVNNNQQGPIQNIIDAQLQGLIQSGGFLSGFTSNSTFSTQNSFPLKDFEDAKFASKSHGLITSYSANTHQGIQRNYNEDRVSIILNMSRPEAKDPQTWPKCSFFAIYDGHGGSLCADFLKDHLHQIIITQPCFPQDPRQALMDGCEMAEERFLRIADQGINFDKSGSCAIIIMTVETECYVANVGDSRAIMSQKSGMRVFELSQDHRPNEEGEFYRIQANGGQVYQTQSYQNVPITNQERQVTGTTRQMLFGPYRVLPGRLSVSRTFGDIEAKLEKYGGKKGVVSAIPEISQFTIDENISDFIVLGCDGIFDRLSTMNAIDAAWSSMAQALKQ